jgi:uncharacterized damage-inducible protein DinB
MNMGPMMQAMAEHLRLTNFIMNVVTSDVKEEDAKQRARDSEGPSISWIVGHLLGYRYDMMKLLGQEKANPLAGTFGSSATDGSDYPSLKVIVAAWNGAVQEFDKVIASVGDEQILAKMGGDGSPHGEKTVLQTLSFFLWHESYHMGQLGTLRTQWGYRQTSDIAQEAAKTTA